MIENVTIIIVFVNFYRVNLTLKNEMSFLKN